MGTCRDDGCSMRLVQHGLGARQRIEGHVYNLVFSCMCRADCRELIYILVYQTYRQTVRQMS
jgi:hypothetical protein